MNRFLAVLRSVLNTARKEGWIDTVPDFQLLREPQRRIRWLTHAQADQLLAQLPPHFAAMMRFTLATGLRETNVTQLQWSQVDLRHTWASWHVQNGTPLEVLKELGGWESLEMVMRYAHLGGDHLMEHAERITRTNHGTPTKNALVRTTLRR